MVSFKYKILITLISIYVVNTGTICQTIGTDNGNENGVTIFLENNYQGRNTILKPGNYLISELQNIKSIKIPKDFEVFLSNKEDFDDESAEMFSCPTIEELNNNTSVDEYKVDNIDISKYKYLYVLKVDLNNEDGIADQDEYDKNTCKYFGRHIKNMKELSNAEKEKLIEIVIDNSPNFQGLPDLIQYKNLKDIKILFNVLKNKDESFIKREFDNIINYIDKVNPLRVVEIQGEMPSYEKIQNGKFFGFNLEILPNISTDIKEIHLINCKKLSNIDFSKYNNLQKLYMYGNTLESATEAQWKTMISQIFALSNKKQATLTHIQLPKTFTGEIPKIGDTENSQIQYFSALGATSVAQDAFIRSKRLVEVNLPKVKIIGQGAFNRINSLKIVNIPEVEKIVKFAFEFCDELVKVGDIKNISGNNGIFMPKVKKIEDRAFMTNNHAQKTVTSIILPECEEICTCAFYRYRKVECVSIPKCKIVGEYAFFDLYSLRELEATSLETISSKAFQFCDTPIRSFKTVNGKKEIDDFLELPNCKIIGSLAFGGNNEHYIKGTDIVKLPKATKVANDAFKRAFLKKLEAPNINNVSQILSNSNSG